MNSTLHHEGGPVGPNSFGPGFPDASPTPRRAEFIRPRVSGGEPYGDDEASPRRFLWLVLVFGQLTGVGYASGAFLDRRWFGAFRTRS